jgi:hypothetical protein
MYKSAVPELVIAVKYAFGTNDKISSVCGNKVKTDVLFAPSPVGMTQFVAASALV